MAINLNPGADATLVSAAYRAGMATTPADYSKTFESVAKSYEKTMEAQAEMWKDIGNVVGVIGADMVANANEFMDYRIKGGALNPDSAKFLVDELEANKQAQKDLGLLPGILGDKETRDEKRRLKSRQRELFAEIDFVANSLDAGAEAVAAGLFDENLAPQDAEIINAIIKSNLKDKITESGFQTVLSRDEKTDQLVFNLLDKDGNPVTSDATGNRLTMTMKEFNKSIATNVKDTKNVIGNAMGTIENEIATLAAKSKSGVIDKQTLQLSLNRLDGLLQTDTDVRRAMQAKYGYLGTSFADDIKTKGKVSEEIYASLIRTIGKTEGGQVKAEGTLANIDDTDGILGLSQEEINNAYGIYSANILGMKDPEVSKAVFKASYADRMREAHIYGYSKRTITLDGVDGDDDIISRLGTKDIRMGESRAQYGNTQMEVSVEKAGQYIKDVESGTSFTFQGHSYDYIDDSWYEDYEDIDAKKIGEGTKIGTADDIEFNVFKTGLPAFRNLKTEKKVAVDPETGEVKEEIEPKKTELFNLMNVRNDDTVSENLNTKFNLTQRGNVMFAPYEGRSGLGEYGTGLFDADDTSTNDLMLYNPQTQEPYKINGEIIRIPSGLERSEEEMMKSIDDILKHLGSLGVKTGFGGKTAKEYIEEGKSGN